MQEVSTPFEGIEYSKWQMLKITEQCSEISRAFLAQFPDGVPDDTARALGKRLYTKRDGYGMKGIR